MPGDKVTLSRIRLGCFRIALAAVLLFDALHLFSAECLATQLTGSQHADPRLRHALFSSTGLAGHGVFADWQFADYRYQLRLRPAGQSAMPYGASGQFRWSMHDRVWEDWWKRVQAPWLSASVAERGLVRWARWCWPKGKQTILIEGRPQEVSLYSAQPQLFRSNLSKPWQRLGTIALDPDRAPDLRWDQTPRASQFGFNLERALATREQ